MGKIIRITESDLRAIVADIMKEQQEDTIVPCSSLGIKTPGFCDKNTKKVLDKVPCAKLGIKSPGMCDVKTKKPV